ncbi:hypothetical protein CAEBREN_18282 [Caenorhabditis brenneri]|uniref:Uncharacterized protein n=1 Tax=Caenorhabditis brenneri TaxID=135651 RepID=G0MTW1_CAEBE|nr:hypothetical protein CAEBREN_18282 [Caenorhabditis brenneri]
MKQLWLLIIFLLPMVQAAPKRSYSAIFGYDAERQTITIFWALPILAIGTGFGIVVCYVAMQMSFWRAFGCDRCDALQASLDQLTTQLNQCRPLLDELFRSQSSLVSQTRGEIRKLVTRCTRLRKQIEDIIIAAAFHRSDYQNHQALAGLITVLTGTSLLLAKQLHKIPKDVDWIQFFWTAFSSVGAPSSSAAIVAVFALVYPRAYMYRPFFLVTVFFFYCFAVGFLHDRATELLDSITGVVVGIIIVDGFIHANKYRLFEESFSVVFLISILVAVVACCQWDFVEVDLMVYLSIIFPLYVGFTSVVKKCSMSYYYALRWQSEGNEINELELWTRKCKYFSLAISSSGNLMNFVVCAAGPYQPVFGCCHFLIAMIFVAVLRFSYFPKELELDVKKHKMYLKKVMLCHLVEIVIVAIFNQKFRIEEEMYLISFTEILFITVTSWWTATYFTVCDGGLKMNENRDQGSYYNEYDDVSDDDDSLTEDVETQISEKRFRQTVKKKLWNDRIDRGIKEDMKVFISISSLRNSSLKSYDFVVVCTNQSTATLFLFCHASVPNILEDFTSKSHVQKTIFRRVHRLFSSR